MVSELQRERTLAVHDRTLALCQQSAYQSEAAALRAEAQRSMLLGHAGKQQTLSTSPLCIDSEPL